MDLLTINPHTCNRDGLCAAVCPVGIIDWTPGNLPAPAAQGEEVCVHCGHCVAICPTGSLDHQSMRADQCPPLRPEWTLSPEQGEQFIRARRSIRTYRDQPVAREQLERLIKIASHAPTGHNTQGVRWLVLADPAELQALSGLVIEWLGWLQTHAPEMARAWHLDRTLERWRSGHDVILRGAPAVIVAHAAKDDRLASSSCTIALATLELAAIPLGLGCCWAGYFNAAAAAYPPMGAALGLPDGHQSFGAMMVGHPQYRYHRLPLRNQPEITWRMEGVPPGRPGELAQP